MSSEEELWRVLFQVGAISLPKPKATLFEVIVDIRDLDLAKRYVAGGHEVSQRFYGGHSLALAAKYGDLDFVKFFIENANDLDRSNTADGAHSLLSDAVERIGRSGDDELQDSIAVFEYLLGYQELRPLYVSAYRTAAAQKQVTPAQMLIAAGLEDQEVRTGPKSFERFSDNLEARGFPEFAALLRGDTSNVEKLKQQEIKERASNFKLKSTMDSITRGGTKPELSGDALAAKYNELVDDVRAGRWTDALSSVDPHHSRSVVEFAAQNGMAELIDAVFNKVKVPPKAGNDAAIAAATFGHLDVLQCLHKQGVKIQKTTKSKNSPLSEACRYGYLEIVQLLLELGANPDCGESSGHDLTMDDLAGGVHRNEIIAVLKLHRSKAS